MADRPEDLEAAMRRRLEEELLAAALEQAQATPPAELPAPTVTPEEARAEAAGSVPPDFAEAIADIAATVLKIPRDRLDVRENMSRYGVDSIIVTEIVKRISDLLELPIAPTVFFEARHLEELADILYRRYGRVVAQRYGAAGAANTAAAEAPGEADPPPSGGDAETPVAEAERDGEAQSWIERFRAIAAAASGEASVAPEPIPEPPAEPSAEPRRQAGAGYEPLAIIAMEGLFPQSADLEAFERHLRAGDDCIGEVPADRWDWRQVFGDPQDGELTRVKYGGFAPDIDKFDPLFFGMSPREAELMDPQHRLFMQCVWKLIEAAGYAPRSLSGRKVGVFLGINLQDYAHMVDRAGAMEALHLTSLGHMFCPNRLSFNLDLHGPSQVIDTACSSSLVALHRAALSIQHEGCEMAIAGGANLLISPDMHIMYSKVGMICEDGRCKTFSRQANGYVRADGVGAVLLKPLASAERDGDPILAVIRGSAENHGGMSTSLTAPNPKAQASLIVEAHRRAGSDPRSIGYIECHGTGTALGDPIEVNGLKMAFEELHRGADLPPPDAPYCGLGSVKSNIGHAETAAGIAGVIKAVLALRNRRLYPTLHCDELNPMIELEGSPFFVLQQGREWTSPIVEGEPQPRRAGVSSFGAGGSNAHVVLEEYVAAPAAVARQPAPALVLLSARNEERLGALAGELVRFLEEPPGGQAADLADLAYTLQVGREAMAERLALVVGSPAELREKLAAFAGDGATPPGCWRGRVRRGGGRKDSGAATASARLFAEADLQGLAELWSSGAEIDWPTLHAEAGDGLRRRPRRVPLPTYPFAKRRCWLPEGAAGLPERRREANGAVRHPLVQQNSSDLAGLRFTARFTGREFFLADHRVMGQPVLPGVAYLEMARAAVAQASGAAAGAALGLRLRNVVWARPFAVGEMPAALHIGLQPQTGDQVAYRIYSEADGAPVLHSQGAAILPDAEPGEPAERLDPAELRDRITGGQPERHRLEAVRCYQAFTAMGIAYGAGHQCLDSVYFSVPGPRADGRPATPEVLAKLVLSPAAAGASPALLLNPGLIDSALQACIGLLPAAGLELPDDASPAAAPAASLPFALDELELLARPAATLWAWVRQSEGSRPGDRLQKLDIDLCDEEGRPCLRLRGFSSRAPEQERPAEGGTTLLCRPAWVEAAADGAAEAPAWSAHRVVLCDLDGFFPATAEAEIAARLPGATCSRLELGGAVEDWYGRAAVGVFEVVRQALTGGDDGRTLVQVAIPRSGEAALLGGLSGLLQTANRESSRVVAQLVELEAAAPGGSLAERLAADSRRPGQTRIRWTGSGRQVLQWRETERADAQPPLPWKDGGVYLIAGGSGGLGLSLAGRIARHCRGATVVLCGRSEPDAERRARFEALAAAGLDLRYRRVDIARAEQVEALVAEVADSHGRLDGVVQCAGLLRDNFIAKKSAEEFHEVLAPKVAGTLNLDRATAAFDLDFFALFASAAGAWGSAGQADYAAANGFLDAFAERRSTLVRDGRRRGRTVAIDWPLWAEGGMRMEPAALAMMEQGTGMTPLPTEAGLLAFEEILASEAPQVLVLHGAPTRLRRLLAGPAAPESAAPAVAPEPATADPAEAAQWRSGIQQMLLRSVAALMKFELQDLSGDTEWSDLGFDSITLTEFSNRLNQQYRLDLAPTVFFEYPTAETLAAWLAQEHGPALAAELGLKARPAQEWPAAVAPTPAPATTASRPASDRAEQPPAALREAAEEAVAIVGMSGRFPMARDLDAFWENLLAGRDCITEIPPDRWDPVAREAAGDAPGWGGFIEGIGDFDARFFGISPREAELMDPQQRLLLQYGWKAIEDAGYAPGSLAGSNTAVFVATAPSGYGDLMARRGFAAESYSSTGVIGSIGPSRLSYLLNLHGPSEPIETACSSALVAIHRALAALAHGDCDQAIAGGINLIVSPETHVSFDKAGMLSPDGRCKTFSKQANGYVRGEGVGMLFLKRLSAAEQAGDRIYAVIRASGENHGGRSNSLTAPNPKAQAELVKAVLRRAGVDPRTVGYIEAHGTGTALGDPIEVTGLKTAFRDLCEGGPAAEPVAHCGLGSVKTNIGHLELAAGIAGVIKVLLQLKHRTLVRSLHCEEVNPYLQLEDSPFYLVRENREWAALRDSQGRLLPRRAGVSSFGFGGVNAHLLLEEYPQPQDEGTPPEKAPRDWPVVLSAKNPERLKAYAESLLAFVTARRKRGGAGQEEELLARLLADRLRQQLAELLRVGPAEIEATQPLDDYGVEPLHRSLLGQRLQGAWGVAIEEGALFENHSLAAIAAALLERVPALRERLQEEAPAAVLKDAEVRQLDGGAPDGLRLADLAYTLQVGRDAMEERLGVLVGSLDELADKLRAFLEGRAEAAGVQLGQTRQNKALLSSFAEDEELQEALDRWLRRGKLPKLLDLWTKGLDFDWERLYGASGPYSHRPRRISLPGYPFAEQRHWVTQGPDAAPQPSDASRPAALHPLVQENVSTLRQVRFSALLDGSEFFLVDHRVQGHAVLPGVAYLEMARAAFVLAGEPPAPGAVVRLQDVAWVRPAVFDAPRRVTLELTPLGPGEARWEVFSEAQDGAAERQAHGGGRVALGDPEAPPRLDPAGLLAGGGLERIEAAQCYALFRQAGLDYGPAHRGIAELHVGPGQVLARLALPQAVAGTLDSYVLHPSLLDSALQASIGLGLGGRAAAEEGPALSLPFAVEAVEVFGACAASLWAWVRPRAAAGPGQRLQKLDIDICDERGLVCARIKGLSTRLLDGDKPARRAGEAAGAAAPPPRVGPMAPASSPAAAGQQASPDPSALRSRTVAYFKELLSTALKFPIEEIRADDALDSYGIDSMMVMELTAVLEKPFGELSKTLFFEYQTLGELVDHFLEARRPQLLALFEAEAPAVPAAETPIAETPIVEAPIAEARAPSLPAVIAAPATRPAAAAQPGAGPLDIAIVGLSGRYPQSPTLEDYWRNLREGRDCITEVPADRWDWRAYQDGSGGQKHLCRWGGFLADADKFDPLFFSISPSAADYLDPQERLFLEHAWMALEDAGYRREDLQQPLADSPDDLPAQVGVYAGVMYGEYQLLGLEASLAGNDIALGNFYASIANRVSYALNLHGPSMAVDTMCSSSLTAIHLACQDLVLRRTDLALAGGVNLSLHPNKYSLLSLGQFISGRGKCESFGGGGEGYVPSEGVGVVVLKRLGEAERDGDHIYGVIKSSALNHGGKTNGYSVPNPRAQQMVVARAVREGGIDPRAIGYVEAHGTGTRLGDPIEIAGLTRGLGSLLPEGAACWIGSSKSNIGHSEAAAGIAGLTKVLLQMRAGEIAPSLHAETLNPNIDFSATPFRVNRELRAWPAPVVDGRRHRRAAGISSFGAGGANAHLIVEEYLPAVPASAVVEAGASQEACAFVLSARSEAQLREYAGRLLRFLDDPHGTLPALRDIAFTLQLGREAMQYRLGCLAASYAELADRLGRFLDGDHEGLLLGRVKPGGEPEPGRPGTDRPEGGSLLADWMRGVRVDWRQLYGDPERPPRRVSLPTYPFARERYWVKAPAPSGRPLPAAAPASDPVPIPAADLLLARPVWRERPLTPGGEAPGYGEHRVLYLGRLPEPGATLPGAGWLPLQPGGGTLDSCFGEVAVQLFEQVRELLRSRPAEPVLLQVVIADDAQPAVPSALWGALAALLKTARMENPRLVGQLIELDGASTPANADVLAGLLRDNGRAPAEPQVRYRQGRREIPAWEELADGGPTPRPVWKQGGVYLITGGAGGLGLIFAGEIVRQLADVTLILTGRSSLDAARSAEIEALRAQGARVEYRPLDVGDAEAVHALLDSLERDGGLNGIIHSAGIIRDAFLLKKSSEEFRAVLRAKVSGVVNLDRASRGLDLDFLILFSSLAGAVGNPGQGDYATANAFLDAYAGHRNRLVASAPDAPAAGPPPRGHTLSLDWPLWAEGGMDVDAAGKEAMWRTVGLRPLESGAGIEAFYRGLEVGGDQLMVLQGDGARLRAALLGSPPAAPAREPEAGAQVADARAADAPAADGGQQVERVEALVTRLLSELLRLPVERIEPDVPLEEYGIDSVAMMKLTDDLERAFGPLPKTLLFEYPTVEAVSAHLAVACAGKLVELFGSPTPATPPAMPSPVSPAVPLESRREVVAEPPRPAVEAPAPERLPAASPAPPASPAGERDIAVIGMAGRFPGARDVEAFWRNLAEGRDCITEVPPERWDHAAFFDRDLNKAGKTYCKWGGFLDEIDRFDAAFFRIPPGEADLLDPQEKLFLETVWNLLESSGYLGERLRALCGPRVGVFVGSMSQQYHAFRSDLLREAVVALSSPSSIANRVSYFFDFQGPSVAIDTMCSSALNAVHMACDSLLKGECRVAIAGGVNLTIHPKKYLALSVGQMIGSHPDSTSFGDGDGYLPAEAVGAVLLKPLAEALADGDEILAVVKATAVNHGGQSNGYRVPNTTVQAELIAGNFARAGIDPRTVSYVESAANGSPLGDLIELRALTAGFQRYTSERQFCAIGSVKSTIGHAEAASGISQLIKVILQLRHRQLAPTIKAEPLNPNIDFAQTPFYLQRRLEEWRRPVVALEGGEARPYPRRATISSFGAGGSNAHLIVEEFAGEGGAAPSGDGPDGDTRDGDAKHGEASDGPQLILLSARTAGQLETQARQLLDHLERRPALPLADLAYTLQTAREAMAYRLALVVEGRDQLLQGLRDHLAGGKTAALFTGSSEEENAEIRQLLSGRTGRSMLELLLAERDLEKLALYWVKGARIAWQPLHQGAARRLVALPTYPFERQRYWLPDEDPVQATSAPEAAFALDPKRSLQENMERYLTLGLASLLGVSADSLGDGGGFHEHGLDSLALARLRRGFEQVFQMTLSARDLVDHPSARALAALAAGRQGTVDGVSAAQAPTAPTTAPALSAFPLSEGQKGLWLLNQLAPTSSAYNVPIALRLDGRPDAGLLRQACERLLRRFPILGARFRREEGELRQILPETAQLRFEQEDTEREDESGILELLRARGREPFDLARGPLFRVHLVAPAAGTASYLLLVVHHIVFDGSSATLLLRALLEDYRALAVGEVPALPDRATNGRPDRPTGYGDFVRWQQAFLAGERAQAQLAYWKAQLSGDLPAPPLLHDLPGGARAGLEGASHEALVAPELADRLNRLAASLRVTPAVVFLGALKLLLHRHSGAADVVVGMPTAGRPEERFDSVIGYFVNLVAVRSRIEPGEAAAGFLRRLQLTLADALDNADYPFPALLQALRIERDRAGRQPFQALFAYQSFVRPEDAAEGGRAGLAAELLPGIAQEGGQDFALEVYPAAGGFRLRIDYDSALFRPETIRRAMAHYLRLLQSLADRPEDPLDGHELLSPEELQQVLAWSDSRDASVGDGSLLELIARQAEATPDATALLFEGRTLSYAELERQSGRLAARLLERGLAEDAPVGVCLARGPAAIVALLAIWKAGGVYLPLAADGPPERLRRLLDDSGMKLLLTDEAARDRVAEAAAAAGAASLAVEELLQEAGAPAPPAPRASPPQSPAYVIYTSGSTGQPKGVVVTHASIGHHCRVMREQYRLTADDRVLQFASTTFDASLEQILPALLCGATLVIRPDELWSARSFAEKVAALGVTVIDVPPSLLHELLLEARSACRWQALASLRLVITGGEPLAPETVALWRDSPLSGCPLVNAYGPTEATITSTLHEVPAEPGEDAAGTVPIGRPLPGERTYVLDSRGRPLPVGVPGELHIGGMGVAAGYLNRPDLTRERFIENPLAPGSRLFRTGDRARWRADGTLEFLGRLDEQVKVRGFRIECGEVEAALRGLESIEQAAVLPRRIEGRDQLVAFVATAENQPAVSQRQMKDALARRLPSYMIPAIFVSLPRLPVTPAGKLDRGALARHELERLEVSGAVAPRSELEAELAEIWRQVLQLERIGVHDSFFDLGGDSLLALRLVGLIDKQLGREIPIASLFEFPDIAAQARLLQGSQSSWSPLVCLQPKGKAPPLFCVHGAAGGVLVFAEFARQLGEQRPFYGLQAPERADGAHPGSVEGLAALYVEAIREVQPHGPYRLAGWSMGGVIAYEMAGQLQEAGEEIAMLALLDSFPPALVKAFEEEQLRQGRWPDEEALLLAGFTREFGIDELAVPGIRAGDADERLQALLEEAGRGGLLPTEIEKARRMFAVYRANVRAMNGYRGGCYRGPATLFAAAGLAAEFETARRAAWSELTGGRLESLVVPGDHFTLLRQPYLKGLVEFLMRRLDK